MTFTNPRNRQSKLFIQYRLMIYIQIKRLNWIEISSQLKCLFIIIFSLTQVQNQIIANPFLLCFGVYACVRHYNTNSGNALQHKFIDCISNWFVNSILCICVRSLTNLSSLDFFFDPFIRLVIFLLKCRHTFSILF